MTRKIAAIVNPASARGKTAKLWPLIAQAMERRVGQVTVRFSEAPGHAAALARELLRDGFDLIVAVGGDGTASEIANGFVERGLPVRPDAALGIVPIGTGGDFQRTLGIPSKIDGAIETLVSGVPLEIDVGKVSFINHGGSPEHRYFVNLVSFGMGGDVAVRAKNPLTAIGGKAAFLWATLVTVLDYRGKRVHLELDGQPLEKSFFVTNVAVGNGRFHGGGMHPCPQAVLNDGLLDVTVIDYLPAWELVRDIHVLYSDNVYRHPKVHPFRARTVTARAEELTRIEVDGEALGSLPLEITLLPRCLTVVVPASTTLVASDPGPG